MLKSLTLEYLRDKKNLLAFSGGVDSTALFFLLCDANISFDIAIVDYEVREQSKEEVLYAQELCKKFEKTCHLYRCGKIEKNFEAQAREIRYDFFKQTIEEHHYENLLTAHHLGDRLEWMLMQFCKGAGCVELAGMQNIQNRENYKLIRPLLHLDKSELLEYLQEKQLTYFEDISNLDLTITRNSFRHNYSNPMLKNHLEGIKKSFQYIDEDISTLDRKIEIESIKELIYFPSSDNKIADVRAVDNYLKQQGYMLSANERKELKIKKTHLVGRKFVINQEHDFVFILPMQTKNVIIPKEFKEKCRVLQIEPKLRPYLYENEIVFLKVKDLLTSSR